MEIIEVAAGLVFREGKLLITQRHTGTQDHRPDAHHLSPVGVRGPELHQRLARREEEDHPEPEQVEENRRI